MFQATVKIEVTGGPIIYIDPTNINGTPADADFVLLTHNHGDHQSIADLNRVRKAATVFVSSPPGVPALMTNFPNATIHAVTPGTKLTLGGVEVETVPMYNIIKFNNHPRVMNFVGYVLDVGGVKVYQAGDTERIPEMKQFSADVVLLPLGQGFTMTSVQDAVAAAFDLKARVAIPIHWGNAEGSEADADYFVAQLSSRMQAMKRTGAEGFALEVSETIAIGAQPESQTVAPGSRAMLAVQATGAGTLRYQWRRNGVMVPGATAATLELASAGAGDAADYEVIVTDANGPVRSRAARLTVATPEPGRLVNLSVRATAQGGGTALIVGAGVAGGSKEVLVRGIGPTLAAFGVAGAMPDPRVEVHATVNGRDTILASNNDWGSSGAAATTGLRSTFAAVGAFGLGNAGAADREAALVTTLDGPRTVHVADTAGRSGIALVELYDTQPAGAARLTNLSARSFAGTGDGALMVGFVISGNVPKRLLVRGVGPRLASGFGVTGALADPKLDLFVADGGRPLLVASNDNWADGGAARVRAAFAATGAFDLPDASSRDAAMVVTVPAGAFTAQVSGVGGTTGEALIEVYELP
jgi:L-ascorbate metabolism protein UlaG (beta-lactamase superfamily)